MQEEFKSLKEARGKELDDEALWKLAVKGEDRRGRLYGFGNRSRMSKANRELEAMEASLSEPTKSTATSAEHSKKSFTAEEVAELIQRNLAEAQKGFAKEKEAQERRHRLEMEENKKEVAYNRVCINTLYDITGAELPDFNVSPISRLYIFLEISSQLKPNCILKTLFCCLLGWKNQCPTFGCGWGRYWRGSETIRWWWGQYRRGRVTLLIELCCLSLLLILV